MVIWTDTALNDMTKFIDIAREGTEEIVKRYLNKLIDYVSILKDMPNIGKQLEADEIRELIYKKHKIIYKVENEDIYVLTIIHTKQDFNSAIQNLINNINNY